MKLFLIRHGETEWNNWRKLQGQVNIPINKKGEQQAQQLAKILKNTKFDAIYSSPLNRCVATAEIVCGNESDIKIEPLIMEMAFGIYEGFDFSEIDLDEGHDLFDFFYDRINYNPPAGAESLQDVAKRAKAFMSKMLKKYNNKTVVAFTHGAFKRCAISVVRNLRIDQENLIKPINNCAVSVFKSNGKKVILEQEAIDVINGEKLVL